MSESVNLPALGESVTEGTVTRWLKKVGDWVEVDEPLLEVSTDKVDTEIPSPVAGVIEAILVAEDETVEVGAILVTIGNGSESAAPAVAATASEAVTVAPEEPATAGTEVAAAASDPEPSHSFFAPPVSPAVAIDDPVASVTPVVPLVAPVPPTTEAAPAEPESASASVAAPNLDAIASDVAPEPTVAPGSAATVAEPAVAEPTATPEPAAGESFAGYVTPIVRKLANERGVDLVGVTGTGVGGRIRKQDILAATSAAASVEATPEPTAPEPVAVSPLRGSTVPMSRLRKVIAERAVASMQSSAQLTSVVEVDVTAIAQFRNQVKEAFQQKTGVKLSFLPFFARAAAEALQAYPIINATIDGETISYPPQENLSIAVDTERGLLTPVVRNAADLDIAGLASQIAELAERTRGNQLKPDELTGGTFTLTNTGSRGALFDTPIVFQPQSAILGTGIVTKKPVVVSDATGDAIAVRSMVYLALSYDHRIIDGADAARFLTAVKDRLESGDFASVLGI